MRKNFAPSNPFWQKFCNRVLKVTRAGMILSTVRPLVAVIVLGQSWRLLAPPRITQERAEVGSLS